MGIDWFTPLYLLAIYGLVKYFSRQASDSENHVNWSPLEAVGVTLAIYFGAQVIGGLIAYLLPLIKGLDQKQALDWLENNVIGQFTFVTIVELLSVYFLYKFLKRRRADFETIGLKRHPQWGDFGYVLVGFLMYFVSFAILSTVIKHFAPGLNESQSQQIGFQHPAHWQLPFVLVSLVILPPLVEELLVRGFLYTGLKNGLPKMTAVLVASLLFAVAHLQAGSGQPLLWIAGIDTFTLSLVLIYLREKTGSLWASIGLHMLKNGIAFLSLFIFHLT